MNSVRKISRWQKGPVDRTKEHFELRCGLIEDAGWSAWIPVALIGPPMGGVVQVQFLVEPGDPKKAEAVSHVKREIQFYLLELGERDPWKYARYHCGTTSNAISTVHWSFFDPGKRAVLTRMRGASTKNPAATRKR
jgi:hypothetical protein